MRQFDGQLRQIDEEIEKAAKLLEDPEMRQLAQEELANLERQAKAIEDDMRKLAPEKPAPTPPAPPKFDVAAFENRISQLPANQRVPEVIAEAERQAAHLGYARDRRVSAINNRDVFRDPSSGHYYSVDTQHGRFEHCDARGTHLEEVKLDGTPVPNSQSNDHSIRI
jgi:hypothetical protein